MSRVPGAAAPDVHRADRPGRRQHHRRAGQPAAAGSLVVADPDSGDVGDVVAWAGRRAGHVSGSRSLGAAQAGEEPKRGVDVHVGVLDQIVDVHELVGLMGDPLAARTVDDRRDAAKGREHRAVGRPGHAAEAWGSRGDRGVGIPQRPDEWVVLGDGDGGPVVDDVDRSDNVVRRPRHRSPVA